MKKKYYTLILVFLTTISFSQGISVQGIARDNASSAITDTNLTFTFSITQDDNTVLYSETQGIRTDNFGVFSHVVSSGNPVTNTFNDIDFAIKNLKLKVSVVYNGTTIEVYDQPFQYAPYAHFATRAVRADNADNGVPPGSIMPYAGETAPTGWVLCKGQSIASLPEGAALRAIVGNNVPNLQGTFLRGTGTSPTNSKAGPALRAYQGDDNKAHVHSVNLNTNHGGRHRHAFSDKIHVNADSNVTGAGGQRGVLQPTYGVYNITNNNDGNSDHSHSVNGNTGNNGNESRPVNYGVNYIIKL